MPTTNPPAKPTDRNRATALVVVLVVVAVVGFFVVRPPRDPRFADEASADQASATTGSAAADTMSPRCSAAVGGPYWVGERSAQGADGGAEEARLDPFAVELGRAVGLAGGGFAVGVKRVVKGANKSAAAATEAAVALLGPTLASNRLVRLGRSRADMPAPVLAGGAEGWVAALLEPNAAGLSLRLVRDEAGKLVWGGDWPQGRDESLAHDIAVAKTGVAVWDEVDDEGQRSGVMLAVFDVHTLKERRPPILVSGEKVDADVPRVLSRPGGFWLAYVARDVLSMPDKPDDVALGRSPKQERFAAEKIDPSWIELIPLDETGKPSGTAQAITARGGHVLAFDLERGKDGGAIVAWRDDDKPSGAGGGRVHVSLVSVSGAAQSQLVAEQDVGSGVPNLLSGWIALPDARGRARLAPLGADGVLRGMLVREPLLGVGQALAAAADQVLIARPAGKAVSLSLIRCAAAADPG